MSAYGWLAADGYWWLAIENLHSCCLNPQIQRRQTKQPRQEWWGHALGAFRKGLGRIVICCVLWKAVEVRGLDHVITPIICVEINYESNVKSDGEKVDMVPNQFKVQRVYMTRWSKRLYNPQCAKGQKASKAVRRWLEGWQETRSAAQVPDENRAAWRR
jgi:hypothetical protein